MRASIVPLLLLSSVVAAEPLRVEIAPSSTGLHVRVVLTNTGATSLRVFTERYSWGYEAVSFEVTGPDGKVIELHKCCRSWDKNVPQFGELAPDKTLVLDETLTSEEWAQLPPLHGRVTMRAVYTIKPDVESARLRVWTGQVRSAAVPYTFP